MTEFSAGIKAALPTALGYLSIGLAFGIIASASGLSALEVGFMSAMVYGGSAQFAMCALLLSGASLSVIVLTVFLVNLRNMLMSLHATTIFTKTSFWHNLVIASLITDESYGVLLGENVHNKEISANWMHGNNLFSYLAWIVATVLGTMLGKIIGDPKPLGLDFALIAMFIGLLWSQIDVMVKSDGLIKVVLILLTVFFSYFVLTIFMSETISVLAATLLACGMGVYLDAIGK